jgi:hypothetical protein
MVTAERCRSVLRQMDHLRANPSAHHCLYQSGERTRTRRRPLGQETNPSPNCQALPLLCITILTNPGEDMVCYPLFRTAILPSVRKALSFLPRVTHPHQSVAKKRTSAFTENSPERARGTGRVTPHVKGARAFGMEVEVATLWSRRLQKCLTLASPSPKSAMRLQQQ